MLTEIFPVKNLSSVKCSTDIILRTVCVDRKRKREKKEGGDGEEEMEGVEERDRKREREV